MTPTQHPRTTDAGAVGADEVVVARIGRPHGVRGEVSVEVRTDAPALRFTPGAQFETDPSAAGPLLLQDARPHQKGWVLRFDGFEDRDAAEELRGVLLLVGAEDHPEDDDEDSWQVEDLVGLRVELTDGTPVGTVTGLDHSPAHDLLLVAQPSGTVALVPFVRAIVPVVDVPAGRVVLDPPGGLVEALPADGDTTDDADGGAADDGVEDDGVEDGSTEDDRTGDTLVDEPPVTPAR